MTIRATLQAGQMEAARISDALERAFGESGAAIALTEAEGGRWRVEAYFEEGEPEEVAEALRGALGSNCLGALQSIEQLPETDWVAAGLEQLKPVLAGRFVVHGGHDREKVPPGRIAIQIDAGQAFGTGHHGTTAGCLAVLDRLVRSRQFRNPLDLGTGSGVLAIALAKTLRRPVLASDIDPVAARVARENAKLNRVGRLVETVTAPGLRNPAIRGRAPFDLVVANILAEPLMRLAPEISAVLASDGVLVLSGLLRRQRERVVAAYGVQGVRLVSTRLFEGWAVLVLARP